MSTDSVSGVSQGLYQFFQSVSANGQDQSTSPTGSASAAGSHSSAASTTAGQSIQRGHHHHRGGQGAQFKQIEDAVTSALQSAQTNGSSDPNQVIQAAIAKVFSANTPSTSPTAAASPAGSAGASSPTDGTTDAARQSFFQTLQSFGVDPEQFHSDFLAAVKGAQDGKVDPSTALRTLPPGAGLDTDG